MSCHSALLLGLVLWLGGCALGGAGPRSCVVASPLCEYDLRTPRARSSLPAVLEEVSGLATLASGHLLAHDDNSSLLWQVRADDGAVDAVATPGAIIDGDFEGVAVAGADLFLLSSRGVVYHAGLTAPGRPDAFTALDSGVSGRCNFEGIAAASAAELYLACKYPRDPRPGFIRLYRLSYPAGLDVAPRWDRLDVDVSEVLATLRLDRLRPSGLAWFGEQGRLLVLVGKERLLLDVDPAESTLIAWRRLQRSRHRQAEGVSLVVGGHLAVADEADGRLATLTVYGRSELGKEGTPGPPGEGEREAAPESSPK